MSQPNTTPRVATHNGPFHADDVTAVALLRVFWRSDLRVVRTRDLDEIASCDAVVDVGGVFDAASLRFDHHQASYQGPLSSAGMVLAWLVDAQLVSVRLGAALREGAVDYLDAVDNGRRVPDPAVPCLPRIIEQLNFVAADDAAFDAAFMQAVSIAELWLRGAQAGIVKVDAAYGSVKRAMLAAEAAGSNVLAFDDFVPWKEPYFALGGAKHPTEFALFPGTDGSWRIVAIPPEHGSFAQKRPLPAAWGGLTDDALVAACGVPGAKFCHKNLFIAVFETREGALAALERARLV